MKDGPAAGSLLQTDKQGRCQAWSRRQSRVAKQRQTEETLCSLVVLFLSQQFSSAAPDLLIGKQKRMNQSAEKHYYLLSPISDPLNNKNNMLCPLNTSICI